MAIAKEKPATKTEACKLMQKTVYKMAHKWARNHKDKFEDLVQEGMIGVCHAYDKYDTTAGSAFSTYAWLWIRHHIRIAAMGEWEKMNNSAQLTDNIEGDTTETSHEAFVLKSEIAKLTTEEQTIINLRTEGFTFQEIADMLEFENLHKARNAYTEIVSKLEAKIAG